MRICVIPVFLLQISSTYLFNTSLEASYFLYFCRAYVLDVVLNCFSFALVDCLRTSNSLGVGKFENEKSYCVFQAYCTCYYSLFQYVLSPFSTFLFVLQLSASFSVDSKVTGKGAKEQQKSKFMDILLIWRSLCAYGVCHYPSLPHHLMIKEMEFAITLMAFSILRQTTVLQQWAVFSSFDQLLFPPLCLHDQEKLQGCRVL